MLARMLADERGIEYELLVPELVARDSTGPAAGEETPQTADPERRGARSVG
jgi:hypothetical protein